MEFKWYKFGTYLVVGLTIFSIWGAYNYNTYVAKEQIAQAKIAENIQIIEETQDELTMEQNTLERIQTVMAAPPPAMEMMPEGDVGRAPSSEEVEADDSVARELQDRIDQLEAEKEQLEQEKNFIKQAIRDSMSVFTGVKTDNPLVNAIIIPIFLYLMKKLIDMLFRRLEERHERRHAV